MAKRMVLVDPKMLEGLNRTIPPVSDPVSDVLKRLDHDMENVLNKRDMPLSNKLTQYNEVLTDYLAKVREYKGYPQTMADPIRQPTMGQVAPLDPVPPAAVDSDAEDVGVGDAGQQYLALITDNYKSKAKRVLNFLKTIPNVSWTPRGELKVGDRVVENSHAVDLVSAAVKPKSRAARPPPRPVGWAEFARLLKQHNAPTDMVGTAMREQMILPSFLTSPPAAAEFAAASHKSPITPGHKRRRLGGVVSPSAKRTSPIGGGSVRWQKL